MKNTTPFKKYTTQRLETKSNDNLEVQFINLFSEPTSAYVQTVESSNEIRSLPTIRSNRFKFR